MRVKVRIKSTTKAVIYNLIGIFLMIDNSEWFGVYGLRTDRLEVHMNRWLYIIWLVVFLPSCLSEQINVNAVSHGLDVVDNAHGEKTNPVDLNHGEVEKIDDEKLGFSFVVPAMMTVIELSSTDTRSDWLVKPQYAEAKPQAAEFYQLEPEVVMTVEAKTGEVKKDNCHNVRSVSVQGKSFDVCDRYGMVAESLWIYQENNFVYQIVIKAHPTMFSDQEIKQLVDTAIEELVFSVNINHRANGEDQ